MSYVRSIQSDIYVSGTTYVNYPASQSGGTMSVDYSETVPVTVNVYVDTEEFDQSVSDASTQVDLLTGALTALEAAQSLEIRRSGERISNRLIQNFYGLIQSDLTMQRSENFSALQAKFALLMSLSRDMAQKHERMEDDIAKLRRHYKQIFDGLDSELKRRILELDLPAFRLTEAVGDSLILEPYRKASGAGMTGLDDTSRASSQLLSARIKDRASYVIDRITGSVRQSQLFTNSTSSLLYPEKTEEPVQEYVPAMYVRTRDLSGQSVQQVFVPGVSAGEDIRNRLGYVVQASGEAAFGRQDPESMERVEQSLIAMMEDGANSQQLDPRVYQQMMALWTRNKQVL